MSETFPLPIICILAERVNAIGEPEILIQRRTKKRNHVDYSGLWELPQGKIRRGESLLDAAKRELKEETGLDIAHITPSHFRTITQSLQSTIDAIYATECVVDLEHQYIGFGLRVSSSGQVHSTPEASEHLWINRASVDELLKQNLVFPLNVPMIKKYFNI